MEPSDPRDVPEIAAISRALIECRRCPRLVDWRESVAETKVARFADESYWGRPVPGFGDPQASIVIVGLAPAAHGANRTGRMFTGDRSGDWLFAALAAVGLANQPTSRIRNDGLSLANAYVTSIVHCAPPGNRPTPGERAACRPWLEAELGALGPSVIVCLGAMAHDGILRLLADGGAPIPRPRPRFGHGAELDLGADWPHLIASYHPSQHNTFTGRLSRAMLETIFERAVEVSSQ